MNNDYLTLVRTRAPANKIVSVKDGKPIKRAAAPFMRARAMTLHVSGVGAMLELQQELAQHDDAILVNGFVPGTEGGTPFSLWAKGEITAETGDDYDGGFVEIDGEQVTARLKKNFSPSSWWQIDRDAAAGCPEHLAALGEDEYIQAIDSILPGFAAAGRVRVASTTGRVLFDGEPMHSNGCRYWFQVTEPDMDGFGKRLKVKAAVAGLGFLKPDKNGKGALWAICDPSVFSPEREIFDGKPSLALRGEGKGRLALRDPSIEVTPGGRVDPGLVGPVIAGDRQVLKRDFQLTINGKGSSLTVVNSSYLEPDTQIETFEHGVVTVRDYWKSGDKKWRCQSTFRDSQSWNGALTRGWDGMPSLIDYGGETRYELSPQGKAQLINEALT